MTSEQEHPEQDAPVAVPETAVPAAAAEAAAPAEDEVAAARSRAQQLRLVEALLFAAPGLLRVEDIARRLPEGAPVEELVQALEEQYAGRGVNVVRIAGKIGLRTAADLAGALDIEVPVTRKLSRAAIETLAIVAYQHAERKPVTRAEIEEIRGVNVGGVLKSLHERGLVDIVGRAEGLGRPMLYGTTPVFLEQFALRHLAELPRSDEFAVALRPLSGASAAPDGELPTDAPHANAADPAGESAPAEAAADAS